MPVAPKMVFRYQGNGRLLLRRVVKVAKQVIDWQNRYVDVERKQFDPQLLILMNGAHTIAGAALEEKIEKT